MSSISLAFICMCVIFLNITNTNPVEGYGYGKAHVKCLRPQERRTHGYACELTCPSSPTLACSTITEKSCICSDGYARFGTDCVLYNSTECTTVTE